MGLLSGCFAVYVFLSLLLHLGEVVLNTYFVVNLFTDRTLPATWFTITMGLMLLPMVMVQLVSAVLLLKTREENLSGPKTGFVAIIHIFQLGFIWRHLKILCEPDVNVKKRDLADLCLLRLFFGFSCSLPIITIQTYFIIEKDFFDWSIISAVCCTLVSVCWTLSSFRRQIETIGYEHVVFTCPGTLFRLTWRLGELVSRVISLIVFASIFHSWVFVVVGLHWTTMLVCICFSLLGSFEIPDINKCYKVCLGMLVSYIYIFCHVNLSSHGAHFRYITYYTIMFLENTVLTLVWYLTIDTPDSLRVNTLVFINCATFFLAVTSMIIYYKCFHISSVHLSHDSKGTVCVQDGCINCKLSLCVKHNKFLQRPFSAGWSTQYQKALINGDYYKNLLQDSFIDSMSELGCASIKSESTSGSQLGHKNTNKEDNVSPFTHTMSFQSSGTYSHRRFITGMLNTLHPDNQNEADDVSESDISDIIPTIPTGSEISENESYMTSARVNRNVTSKTRLLTDSWDNLCYENQGFTNEHIQDKVRLISSAFRPIPHQNVEDWYSDGYSTDHTETYASLPITVLAKNNRCRVSVAASDSTDCTMCRNMRSVHLLRKYSRASSIQMAKQNAIQEEQFTSTITHPDHVIGQGESRNTPCDNILQLREEEIDKLSTLKGNNLSTIKGRNLSAPKGNNLSAPKGHKFTFNSLSSRDNAWYNCNSESGDSAFPQDFSHMESTFSGDDGVSESSYELII